MCVSRREPVAVIVQLLALHYHVSRAGWAHTFDGESFVSVSSIHLTNNAAHSSQLPGIFVNAKRESGLRRLVSTVLYALW